MKKFITFPLLIILSIFLFSVDMGSSSINMVLDIPSATSYSIGFTNMPLNSISQTVSDKSNISLISTISNDTVTASDDTTYLYWKIVSNEKLFVKLRMDNKLSNLSDPPEQRKTIDWKVSNYDVNADKAEEPFELNSENSLPQSVTLIEKASNTIQMYGSRRIVISSSLPINEFSSYKAVEYSSNLILEVVTE